MAVGADVAVGGGGVSVGSGDAVTDAVGSGCARVAGAVAGMVAVGGCGLAVGVGIAAGAGQHAARKARLHTNTNNHRRAATMLASIRSQAGLNPACQVADGRLELHAGVVGTLSSQWTEVPSTPAYRRRQSYQTLGRLAGGQLTSSGRGQCAFQAKLRGNGAHGGNNRGNVLAQVHA